MYNDDRNFGDVMIGWLWSVLFGPESLFHTLGIDII